MNQRAASNTADAAGAELVRTFEVARDELVSTLLFVVGNRDDALDAAQEAFLKCWRSREKLAEVANVRAWVFTVAVNTARDQMRSGWRRKSRPLAGEETVYADAAAPPDQHAGRNEELALLRDALGGLREEEKEVFLLRQNGGLTYEQIAELHGRPVGTIKTQMRTALIKLRQRLAPEPS